MNKGVMHLKFNDVRCEIELIFEEYRKHKYYTLFMNDYDTSVTSQIDDIGGGRSNETSDKVGNHVIRALDRKQEAMDYVVMIEQAVERLPDAEREIIKKRYMTKNHDYISDYTVYEIGMDPPMSAKTYRKIREEAFNKLYIMIVTKDSLLIPSLFPLN